MIQKMGKIQKNNLMKLIMNKYCHLNQILNRQLF